MGSLFGPTLPFEMTTLVRRRRYFALRVVYAVFLFFILWSSYAESFSYRRFGGAQPDINSFSRFANHFFAMFSITQILAVLLLTPAYVGSAVAVEKQRKTIDYLFATDLSNREIVLAKYFARSLNVVMLILAGIPLLSIASLFGGISTERLLYMTIVTLSTLGLAAAMAMFASIHTSEIRKALANAYVWVILFCLAPVLTLLAGSLAWLAFDSMGVDKATLSEVGHWGVRAWYFVAATNPFFVYGILVDAWRPGWDRAAMVGFLAATHAVLTFLLLFRSIRLIRKVHLESASAGDAPRRRFWSRKAYAVHPAPEVTDEPMRWKEWYFGVRRNTRLSEKQQFWMGLFSGYTLMLLISIWSMTQQSLSDFALGLNVLLRTIGTVAIGGAYAVVAIRSASCMGVERDKDCWVSLLTTPLTGEEIVHGKILGAMKPLFKTVVYLLPAWILCMFVDAVSPLALLLLVPSIFAYGIFVAGLGVRESILCKTTSGALGATFGGCLLFGGMGHMFGGILMIPLIWIGMDDGSLWAFYVATVPWVVLGGLPFRQSDLNEFHLGGGGEAFGFLFGGTFAVAAFATVGVLLMFGSMRNFNRWSGRGDSLDRL